MNRLNMVLAIGLAAAIGAQFAVETDPSRPNRDYFPEMVYSRAAESFADDPALAGGGTLRTPPEGTIARGASTIRYAATPEDAVRAGLELTAPPAAARGLERGATVYRTFCVPCHGAGGAGDGAVVARGFPAPPSLLAQKARDLRDGQVFHVMTYGQNNMPSYAGQIDEMDRWRVTAYVRQLQGSAQP